MVDHQHLTSGSDQWAERAQSVDAGDVDGDHEIPVGTRVLSAVHTPGHTQGHFVFADQPGGLLFAGDHVLPTITPSIGFEPVPVEQPLRDFMESLAKVRAHKQEMKAAAKAAGK